MRLIDADELKKKFSNSPLQYLSDTMVKGCIDEAPTIGLDLAAQRWIPVEEQLPEEGQEVLVTIEESPSHPRLKTNYYIDIAIYKEKSGFDLEIGWSIGAHAKVTAWMPMPEPYKRKEDTDNG